MAIRTSGGSSGGLTSTVKAAPLGAGDVEGDGDGLDPAVQAAKTVTAASHRATLARIVLLLFARAGR
jgi:hypothetical protein